MNKQTETIDEYIALFAESEATVLAKVVALMRRELPGATERVQWGMAIFARDGRDVTGVSARQGFFSLYVPNGEIARRFLPQLGKVSAGKGCIRFKQRGDLDWTALRKLVQSLASGNPGTAPLPAKKSRTAATSKQRKSQTAQRRAAK